MNAIVPNGFSARAMLALYLREARYEFLRLLRTRPCQTQGHAFFRRESLVWFC